MNTRPNATVAVLDLSAASPEKRTSSIIDSARRTFHGLTVLEWCIRRLSESTMLDSIVLSGSDEYSDMVRRLCICSARWMPFTSSSSCDRASKIAESTLAQWLVFVEPTCPFVDPVLLDRLISSAWGTPDCDYVGFCATRSPSMSLSRLGLVGEICHRRAIDRLKGLGSAPDLDLSVPTQVRNQPEIFRLRLIPLPSMLEAEHLQFNMETAEDCVDASAWLEAMGDDMCYQRLARITEAHRNAFQRHSVAT